MKICEMCNNDHDGSFGSGRFCSNHCARGFSTKNKRSEINKKISQKLKNKGNAPLIKECKNCSNKFEVKWSKRYKECCSRSCAMLLKWKDSEYHEKMSNISSINAVKKHKDPDIKFGWTKRNKFKMSYPENIANNVLQSYKIKYQYEYSVHPYFIDFALIDYKIAIEIDGQQHLLSERIERDKKKDLLLKNNGWTVYRIKWPNDNIVDKITQILASIPFA
jgi:very-short-patch-repair endonuclease